MSNDGSLRVWRIEDDLVPALHAQTFLHGQDLSATYSPTGKFIAIGRGASRRVFETASAECVATITGVRNGQVMQISPDGHYFASADATNDIVYCVETDSGERLTLSQIAFESRFGWKNDPGKGRTSINQ